LWTALAANALIAQQHFAAGMALTVAEMAPMGKLGQTLHMAPVEIFGHRL